MNQGAATTKMFCPSCGQKLSVPTDDLRRMYRCPRCQEVRAASDLVPKRTTVPAVAAIEFSAFEVPVAAQPVATQHGGRAPDAVLPRTQPMYAVAMPNSPMAAQPPPRGPAPAWEGSPHAQRGVLPAQGSLALKPPGVATAPAPQAFAASPLQSAPQVDRRGPPPLPVQAPPPAPSPRAGSRELQVVEGIVVGTAAAGRFGSLLLRTATSLDRFLRGKRASAVGFAAIAVLAGPGVDQGTSGGGFSAAAFTTFVAVLVVLALARIDAFRDETGFHAKLVERTAVEAGQALSAWSVRIAQASWGQKGLDLAKPILLGGLITAASASLAGAVGAADDVVSTIQAWGTGALTAGACGYFAGWWSLRARAKATGLALDTTAAGVASQSVQTLPLVVDCRDSATVASIASTSGHPLVRALLLELAKPWPRPHYNDEREFQERLCKRLRLAIPEANPRTEVWIGERERADLVLGDKTAGVLIEMKAHANGSSAIQRLVGQSWQYLRAWQGRGPVVLVLCKTAPETAARLNADLLEMRRQGHAVLAVLAAP